MTGPISRNRLLGSLQEAARWPRAHRNTVVTLATALVAARADADGSRYFQDLSERNPADAAAQALAGFFGIRAGHDVAAAIAKLDQAAAIDLGLPQYFRGLGLAELLPSAGPPKAGADNRPADNRRADNSRADNRRADNRRADSEQADQVIADLEFVLAARDQFPVLLLRAAYQALARAYLVLGRQQQAAEALRRSGLGPAPAADVHEFLGDSAGRDAVDRAASAQSRAGRARRSVLRLRRLHVHPDQRGSRRHRRGHQPGPRAGRPGRPWPAGPHACQPPHPHPRSLRPHRRDRSPPRAGHPGHRLRGIPGRAGAAAPLERAPLPDRNQCQPRL
jgi:hypothetical protein